ncbi:flavin reductase family protein [Pseudothermotoga thermarum]|uniref:Flavin reductase domain protein FMN-binding protein n=1 Tax=Pseudothermotoga thermarum DSM 5069 TaxID=688269 RepID=F7YW37_9THEM|nr:flavin reductase family protein [Pseudothermotoga thermarum]AEH50526.1 flavin reductase domain protein FMN-binding protein [Pseudothermotoga thermarum DSM 5069]
MSAIDKLYGPVTIVTVNVEGKMNGITVAWATRVSWHPKIVAVSIGKTRYSRELLDKADKFAVCIMGKGGREVAEYFGTVSGRNVNKFEKISYELSKSGLPIPSGTIAYLECKKTNQVEAGDHIVYFGLVEEEKVLKNEPPLVFGEGQIL